MSGSLGNISIHKSLSHSTREAQFELVYKTYFKRLYAYAKVICDSQELAKDVVADFFFNLWKNQTDLQSIENLETYCFVSVKNQCVHALTKQKKGKAAVSDEVLEQAVELLNPEEVLLEKELRQKMDHVIASLPDQCQLIFRMSREKGLKHQQIAEELGISVDTIKTQLSRAQKKLKIEVVKYYMEKHEGVLPDVRMIGQYLLLAGLSYYEFLNG